MREYYPDVLSALRALLEKRPWCHILDARGLALVMFFRHYVEEPPSDAAVQTALEALELEEGPAA